MTADAFLSNMEGLVKVLGDKKFICGGEVPSIADFIMTEFIDYSNQARAGQAFAKYPTTKAFHERMINLPGIKEFRASR